MIRYLLAFVLLVLAGPVLGQTEITALPFTASTNGATYFVDGELSQGTSGSSGGINVTGDDITIYGTNGATITNTSGAAAISLNVSSGASGLEVYGITFSGGRLLLDLDAYVHDCEVSYAYTDEAAVRFTNSTDGALVENCAILQTGSSRSAIYSRPTATNYRVEGCLLLSSSSYGVLLEGTNGEIVNCTIDAPSTSSDAIRTAQTSGTLLVANCVIRPKSTATAIRATDSGWSGLTADDNHYWTTGDVILYGGTTYTTSTYTTIDAAGTLGDPEWIGATGNLSGNYGISQDSPCLNTGTNGYVEASTDLAGNPRIFPVSGGTVDKGAVEDQTSESDPTGACCISGSCLVITELACGASDYQGDDTDCDPNPCPIVCTVDVDSGDIPLASMSGQVYCINTGEGGGTITYDSAADSLYMFQTSVGASAMTIVGANWDGFTIRDTVELAGNTRWFLKANDGATVTVKGLHFVSDGEPVFIWAQGTDAVTFEDISGCAKFSVSPVGDVAPNTATFRRVSLDCDGIQTESLIGISGKVEQNTDVCGYRNPGGAGEVWYHAEVRDSVDLAYLEDVYIRHDSPTGTSESYSWEMYAVDSLYAEGVTIDVDSTPHGDVQVSAIQHRVTRNAVYKDITVYGRGPNMEQAIEVRPSTDVWAYLTSQPDSLIKCDGQESHHIYAEGINITIDSGQGFSTDAFRVDLNGMSFIGPTEYPDDDSGRGGWRSSERLWENNARDMLVVVTDNGRGVVWECDDRYPDERYEDYDQAGYHDLDNVTVVTNDNAAAINTFGAMGGELQVDNSILVRRSGTTGDPVVIFETDIPDTLSIRHTIFSGPDSEAAVEIGGTPYSLSELETLTGGTSYGNLWVADPSTIFADLDGGDYSLDPAGPAIDFGDAALAYPGDTLDLVGNPRDVGDDIDAGPLEYQGNAEATGACCIVDGHVCTVITLEACSTAGGTYQGDGVACLPDPCPLWGSCCLDDGSCLVRLQNQCVNGLGGVWTYAVDCSPNPCDQPGYCCLPGKGTCVEIAAWSCTEQGGTAGAEDSTCDPDPCSPSSGACCTDSGGGVFVCGQETEAECANLGGIFMGYIPCTPDPCEATPIGPRQRSAIWRILTGER